jgi:hypothetical protein
MRRRSLREIRTRLVQEARNLSWLLRSPRIPELTITPLPLPDGKSSAALLCGRVHERETLARAEALLRGEMEIFGQPVLTGRNIEWRRDYRSGRASGLAYFRRVPYLDFERCGDHKAVWELNRHQHLVVLAQAYLYTRECRFPEEIARQVESWIEQNPFPLGINWASALEVAFRALSWMWVEHLAGDALEAGFRRRMHRELYRHGVYLRNNLSIYFSANTHLTGEAAALHALGCLFSEAEWKAAGAAVLDRELIRQIRSDGSYFEQSSYYQVYSLDIFLFHSLLRETGPDYRERLAKMAGFLEACMGVRREIPGFGDDDGGRFFHPYGPRRAFGRASVTAASLFLPGAGLSSTPEDSEEIAAWWLGTLAGASYAAPASRLFPDAGLAMIHRGDWQIAMDAGAFGPWPSGHSHADTLSFTLCSAAEEILIDPGTYTYVAGAAARDVFRGTAMHNTVRVDGLDQAAPSGPFRWEQAPEVTVKGFADFGIKAECRYRGFVHTRELSWAGAGRLAVTDEVTGPPGVHVVEQFWHAGGSVSFVTAESIRIGQRVEVILPGRPVLSSGGEFGWRSDAYGTKTEAEVIALRWETTLPWRAETVFLLRT